MRDDEDEASMVDSCTTILPSLSLFPFVLSLPLICSRPPFVFRSPFSACSIFLPLSLFCSHILTVLNFITRTFSFTHPRPFLLSSRVFMRVLCATPFLQFSQFNATCRYGFATIPIIRCTHTTSSSIMAMTAVPPFLFMPPYFSPARPCSLCLFVVRCRSLGLFPLTLPFSSLFPIAFSCPRDVQVRQSGEVSVTRMLDRTLSDLRQRAKIPSRVCRTRNTNIRKIERTCPRNTNKMSPQKSRDIQIAGIDTKRRMSYRRRLESQ